MSESVYVKLNFELFFRSLILFCVLYFFRIMWSGGRRVHIWKLKRAFFERIHILIEHVCACVWYISAFQLRIQFRYTKMEIFNCIQFQFQSGNKLGKSKLNSCGWYCAMSMDFLPPRKRIAVLRRLFIVHNYNCWIWRCFWVHSHNCWIHY